MDTKISLIIADDHPIFIDGLKTLLKEYAEVTVVAHALNGDALIKQVELHQPDIVLTDIHMPIKDGIGAAKEIQKRFPQTKVIALTMLKETIYIKKMLAAGVYAYVLKTADKEELIRVIKKVATGEKDFGPEVTRQLMNNYTNTTSLANPADTLTKREKEIVTLIVTNGLTDKEIAEKIFLSPLTVATHRKNILCKLGVKNKVELVKYALNNNLV